MRYVIKQFFPPILLESTRSIRKAMKSPRTASKTKGGDGSSQELDVYWDPEMAEILDNWGEGNAWNDIQLLLWNRTGKVLDIACGTGKVMEILRRFPALELHGCDISDLLISKALARGIPAERLTVVDATAMTYPSRAFDLGYSIGSLEHFTEDGIVKFMHECARVVEGPTFHQLPMSRSDRDEGWITSVQSYHNNSEAWWRAKCRSAYPRVSVLGSSWSDDISVGRWLVCEKS